MARTRPCLRDPDGNGLELAWDRDPSEWPLDAEGHLRFDRGCRM